MINILLQEEKARRLQKLLDKSINNRLQNAFERIRRIETKGIFGES